MKKVINIINLGITFYCVNKYIFFDINNLKPAFYIIPLVFSILFFIIYSKINYKNHIGTIVLISAMWIRYMIVPTLIYFHGSLSEITPTYEYIDFSILLILYEMIMISLVFLVFFNKKKQLNEIKIKDNANLKFFIAVFIVLSFVIVIINPELLGSFDILKGEINYDVLNMQKDNSGLYSIIWNTGLIFTTLYLVNLIYTKYCKKNRYTYVLYSFGIIFIYILIVYIGGITISRWLIIVNILVFFTMIFSLYSNYRKIISSVIFIGMLFFLFGATIQKTEIFEGNVSDNKIKVLIDDLTNPTIIDIYFSGPISVNNAIDMKEKNTNLNIKNLPSDLFNNFPGITSYIEKENTTNFNYNYNIFNSNRSDQIIPLIGQSFTYFGYMFAPLLSMIFTYFVLYFDRKGNCKNDIYSIYIYKFTSIWFAFFPFLNLTILIAWVYQKIVPFYLILKTSEIIKLNIKIKR